jgi:hypothetical protein
MIRLYRHRYSDLKCPNIPAMPAPLFRHKVLQWSGYTGTPIQAQNVLLVRLLRHLIAGTKSLNGLALTAPGHKQKISKWSVSHGTVTETQNI